jgi:hypothetical protein
VKEIWLEIFADDGFVLCFACGDFNQAIRVDREDMREGVAEALVFLQEEYDASIL